ncbi:N-6 DNA methylase [Streptosporangium canum]|uniref:N-6 DNA methylase n=1 Tax=Streptosporangium canum TaxID=324952 RepID=UPI0037A65BA0
MLSGQVRATYNQGLCMGEEKDAVQDDVRTHVLGVLDSLRGGLPIHQAIDALVVNAVQWKVRTSGKAAPDIQDPHGASQGSAAWTPRTTLTMKREQEWLDRCTPEQIRQYLPALLRPTSPKDYSRAEHTTSESLTRVVVTALLAYEKDSRRTGPAELYDPTCGSGTLALSVIEAMNHRRPLTLAGQDVNPSALLYARANAFLSDVHATLSGKNVLQEDAFPGRAFDYAVANIPYGLHWQGSLNHCKAEHESPMGRFPAGLPAHNDASLLFTQILVSKLRAPVDGGGRAVILMAPKPLFDSSGSSIRRWLLHEDLLEAVIALPEGLSANTNIRLYALVLSNLKPKTRRGKIQFIDLRGFYEDIRNGRAERRTVSSTGLEELSRSLGRLKGNATSRTVEARELEYCRINVKHRGIVAVSGADSTEVPVLNAIIPAALNINTWRDQRYGSAPPEVQEAPRSEITLIDVDRIFHTALPPRVLREIQSLGWPTVRLAELVRLVSYVRSTKAPERASSLSAVAGSMSLIMPVEPHLDAVAGDPEQVAPENRMLIMRIDEDQADAAYLAGWLNSPLGRQLRSAAVSRGGLGYASPRAVSIRDAWGMADDTLVALPPLAVQRELARAETVLDAASRRISDARKELWNNPKKRSDIYREASRLIRSGDLVEWASSLPFPIASALWAFESKGDNVHARHKQIFLFWEAAIEFHAAVLISALAQDKSRMAEKFSHFAQKFADFGLTPERATLGVWQIVLQQLTKLYRQHLTGTDTDEQARVRTAFADPPQDFLENLLSTEIVRIFSEVISLRNSWSGHSGAASDDTLNEQLDVLTGYLHALRNAIGDGWLDYPLVRAGGARFKRGVFHHDVEIAMGPNTPFRHEQVQVTAPMEESGLYLLSRDGGRTLPMVPLVQFHPAGFGSSSACYFYNRVQLDVVRLVSYHSILKPELLEESRSVKGLIDAMTLSKISKL